MRYFLSDNLRQQTSCIQHFAQQGCLLKCKEESENEACSQLSTPLGWGYRR